MNDLLIKRNNKINEYAVYAKDTNNISINIDKCISDSKNLQEIIFHELMHYYINEYRNKMSNEENIVIVATNCYMWSIKHMSEIINKLIYKGEYRCH